jgi:hypothetical protein
VDRYAGAGSRRQRDALAVEDMARRVRRRGDASAAFARIGKPLLVLDLRTSRSPAR